MSTQSVVHKASDSTVKMLTKAGMLAASMALVTGCVWKPDLAPTQLQHWELPTSSYVDLEGLKVHVAQSDLCQAQAKTGKENRKPENIVLIHGTSASLHTWNGWVSELDKDYCVVRMDLPAFGLTGPYANANKRYTMGNYVDTVIGVMDQMKIGEATIAGNSLGGGIAWLTTLRHPDRINRLILVDASGFPFTPKHIPVGFKLAQYPILDPLVSKVLPKSLVRKSVESVYADDSKVSDELVNRYYELTRREGNRKALTQRMRESFAENEVAQIGNIKQPTLILWGAKDDLIPLDSAYKFKEAIPNSQLVIFDNLGHVPHEEDPKATVAVVKQFLQQSK